MSFGGETSGSFAKCQLFLRLGNHSLFILDLHLWLGNPKCFYGEKLASAMKVTLSLEKGDLAMLVDPLTEPTFSFSC